MTGVSQTPLVRFASRLFRLLLAIACLAVGNVAIAQGVDTVPPVIELEELEETAADRSQVFTAQIAEDIQLRDATLYYRRSGQLPYTPAPMEAIGTSGFYSVTIPTDNTDLRTIEYYVQARDEAGNRTVSGFAFDPYLRTLQTSLSAEKQSRTEQETTPAAGPSNNSSSFFQRRWVQITLGVVVAGIVVSLADSGGEDSQVVPLQFNLQ